MSYFEDEMGGDATSLNNLYGKLPGMPLRKSFPMLSQSPEVVVIDELCESGTVDGARIVSMWFEQYKGSADEFHRVPFVKTQLRTLYNKLRERGFTSVEITR